MTTIDPRVDPVTLTKLLLDIPSESQSEEAIADALERALRALADAVPSVSVFRLGNTVCARTNGNVDKRIVLAGHIDTVPAANNIPHRMSGDGKVIHGLGAVDMKSGLAVYLNAFAELAGDPRRTTELTFVGYEAEEIGDEYNGLRHLLEQAPEWLEGDLALLGEPSGGIVEAGCQGTLRLRIDGHGTRAHSARSWLGENAAHNLAPVLTAVASYSPRSVTIDGCEYREGLNVVHLEAGVATNTIPDAAFALVNFRFAPDRSEAEALEHALEALGLAGQESGEIKDGVSYVVDDSAPGALPGLGQPGAQALVEAVGGKVRAKFGWTDVARFNTLGVPAVNFGPGDPGFAHRPDEQVPVADIVEVSRALKEFLTS